MSEIIPAIESIFYVKQLLSSELCQTIIANYHRDPAKHPGYAISGDGNKRLHDDVKVSTDLVIPQQGAWAAAFEELNRAVDGTLRQLVAQLPSMQVWPLWWTGYKIQHYPKNQGHFKWHFDAVGPGTWHRQMAMVIYLNAVRDGGETCFHRQNLRIKPVAGDAIFFPTFWTHAHCGEIPRSEDKYVITSFISFVIPTPEKSGRVSDDVRDALPA